MDVGGTQRKWGGGREREGEEEVGETGSASHPPQPEAASLYYIQ